MLYFLYIARGSAAEVRAQLYIASDIGYIEPSTLERLTAEVKAISAMLYNFIESIKRSKFQGAKFKKSADPEIEEFEKYLADIVEQGKKKDL